MARAVEVARQDDRNDIDFCIGRSPEIAVHLESGATSHSTWRPRQSRHTKPPLAAPGTFAPHV